MKASIFLKIIALSLLSSLLSLSLFVFSSSFNQALMLEYVFYILIIVLGISFFVAGSLVEPLEKLKDGFKSISKGEFKKVEIKTGDELEELANSFNIVAEELIKKKKILEKNEEKYRCLVEDVNDWVFEVDNNFKFTYSSPKVVDVLGYKVDEVINKSILDFCEDVERVKKELYPIRDFKKSFYGFEIELKAKNGEPVYLEINGRPFFENGNLKGFRCVGRDITFRKIVEKERAYFASVLEHSVDAIVVLDVDSNIVSWNRGAEMIFGYKADEMIGKPLNSIMPDKYWDKCIEHFKKAVLEGYVRDIETIRIAKDGRKIVVDQTLTSIADRNGNLIGFVAIMRDITKRKEDEIKLREAYRQLEERTRELLNSKKELEYLANIVENSNDAIYSVDLNGIIKSWNKTAERLFGWSKEEAIGMKAENLLPDELKKELDYVLVKIKEGEKLLSFETKRTHKNGSIIDVEVTISPIVGNGHPSGFSVIARDISWKLKAEREMMKKLLRYEIDKGRIYLIEKYFDLALDVFKDLLKCGYSGVILTRKYPEDVGIENVKYYWLSEKKLNSTIFPDVDEIYRILLEITGRNTVVLIDMDYILMKNKFDKVLNFVHKIKDAFYLLKRGVIILVLDPILVDKSELELLKKECSSVKSKRVELPEDVYEVLRYIYMKNRVGERPSIKDVMKNFNITRNTAKRRINYLTERGIVKIIKDGRLKLLEITEDGRKFFI